MEYLPIIGIEVHVELKTKSKMFCGCASNYFGQKPNSHCCPVCLGLPGALPMPNKQAIEWCIQIGLALNCTIPLLSKFDRKNYFYPDLPKGYQISQMYKPLAVNGHLKIKKENKDKIIRINRVHMEEDTGKLLHQKINGENCTLIDFNRSGVPLVEIVSEPDIHNSQEAKEYLKNIQLLIRYLGVSDADMEKGSMRLEPNISLLLKTTTKKPQVIVKLPDYKVEIKNINSYKFAGDAIDYEIKRQYDLLTKGQKIVQETRRWDENKKITFSQRTKEEAKDYRYFPEPDIPPFVWTKEFISNLKDKLPMLPEVKLNKYLKMGIPEKDAYILLEDKEKGNLVDGALSIKTDDKVSVMDIVNVVVNKKVEVGKIKPQELRKKLAQNKSTKIADINLLKKFILVAIKENSQVVADFKNGKNQAFGYLMGQIMKKTQGKADPKIASEILLEILQETT